MTTYGPLVAALRQAGWKAEASPETGSWVAHTAGLSFDDLKRELGGLGLPDGSFSLSATAVQRAGFAATKFDERLFGVDHTGRSIDDGGSLNHLGPAGVMWKQSSSRTPNLPGR